MKAPQAIWAGLIILGAMLGGCLGESGVETGPALEATPASTKTTYLPEVSRSGGGVYVSPTGDDQSNGLSPSTPFRTLGHALETVPPGTVIHLLPGTYHESTMLENIGGAEQLLTVLGGDPAPIFDGERTQPFALWCESCQNIVIENVEFRNYSDLGVGFSKSSQITLRSLIVHHNGFASQLAGWEIEGYGIHIEESRSVTIENNRTYHNGPEPRPFGALGTGINTFMCTDCVIRNNQTYDNIGGGILVEDGVNVLVEGNQVTGNYLDATEDEWWDGGLWVDGGHDITVKNNHFQNNNGPGIEISDEDNQLPYGYVLENNLSTGNLYGIYIWNFGSADFPPERVLKRIDNQIFDNTVMDVWIVPWECPPDDPCE